MTPGEMKKEISFYLETVVPPAIANALPDPLLAIDRFETFVTSDEDSRVCSVFNPGGDRLVDDNVDFFAVRFQLPGEWDPDKYNDIILPLLVDFDPSKIGSLYIEVGYGNSYPHQSENGQTGYCEYLLKSVRFLQKC